MATSTERAFVSLRTDFLDPALLITYVAAAALLFALSFGNAEPEILSPGTWLGVDRLGPLLSISAVVALAVRPRALRTKKAAGFLGGVGLALLSEYSYWAGFNAWVSIPNGIEAKRIPLAALMVAASAVAYTRGRPGAEPMSIPPVALAAVWLAVLVDALGTLTWYRGWYSTGWAIDLGTLGVAAAPVFILSIPSFRRSISAGAVMAASAGSIFVELFDSAYLLQLNTMNHGLGWTIAINVIAILAAVAALALLISLEAGLGRRRVNA